MLDLEKQRDEANQNLNESADLDGPSFAGLQKSGRKPDDPLYRLQTQLLGEKR